MIKQLKLAAMLVPLALSALLAQPAAAVPVTYTFSGTGTGTGTGGVPSFADADFTFTFTADTADIDASGAPYFRLYNVGGTFAQGAFTGTLESTITLVASADPSLELINFFNADVANGLGLNNSALDGYDLSASIGPLSANFLTPTFNGGSFDFVGGGTLEMTGNTSLTFTADVESGVPEPITLTLFGAGLTGLGAARRRKTV